MAKRHAKAGAVATAADPSLPPPGADLSYIPEKLRPFAVRIDSLVLDPANIKDHGEADLPTHQQSLRDFGIRRLVVVRRENRQIIAGNGTVQASQRNGWEYVPVLFTDDDVSTAKAFALADNAIGTLAGWNDDVLKELQASLPDLEYGGDLDIDSLLTSLMSNLNMESDGSESDGSESDEPGASIGDDAGGETDAGNPDDVQISHRVTVICKDEAAQKKLIARLEKQGFECQVANRRIR